VFSRSLVSSIGFLGLEQMSPSITSLPAKHNKHHDKPEYAFVSSVIYFTCLFIFILKENK